MSLAERALDIVRKHGTARSSAIAEALDCTAENVHELLLPRVLRGELVSCDVQVGEDHLKDYRVAAAAAGGKARVFNPRRSDPSLKKPPQFPAAAAQPKQEEHPMTVVDRLEATLKERGPATSPELRKLTGCANPAAILSKYPERFAAHDGGGPRKTVWALPGQKLAAEKRAAAKSAPAQSAPASRGPAGKRKATRAKPVTAAAPAGAFRPSITVDGAVILTGTERAWELNDGEIRVLREMFERFHLGAVA